MKKLVAVVALLLGCSCAANAGPTKVDPAGYTIPVHVSAARAGTECFVNGQNSSCLDLDVVIAGKKYVLRGGFPKGKQPHLLTPGNYNARILTDDHNASGSFWQEYELLLLDNSTTWTGSTSGVSE